mgnify:FL=1
MAKVTAPVFPVQDMSKTQWPGLRERDLFAAMAMQGLAAAQPDHWSLPENERRARNAVLALQAVDLADALIEELSREESAK